MKESCDLVTDFTPYRPRRIRFLGLSRREARTLKTYGIDIEDRALRHVFTASGHGNLDAYLHDVIDAVT